MRSPARFHHRSQGGFTLIEVIVAIGLMAIVMIPLFAWISLVFTSNGPQNTQLNNANNFGSLSTLFTSDVEAATDAWIPAVSDSPACPLTGQYPASSKDALVLEAQEPIAGSTLAERVRTVYTMAGPLASPAPFPLPTLWRTRCYPDRDVPTSGLSSMRAMNSLVAGPGAPASLPGKYVTVTCTSKFGTTDDDPGDPCRVISLTVYVPIKTPSGPGTPSAQTARAMRRPDPDPSKASRPRAVITCTPECSVDRDASQNGVVALDGSHSSPLSSITTWKWSFGDSTPSGSGGDGQMTPPTHSFHCVRTLPSSDLGAGLWDDTAKECRFTVSLTVLTSNGLKAKTSTTIVVRNALPVLIINPTAVSAHRGESILFTSSGTADPDGSGSTIVWNFGDPLSGSTNNSSMVANPPAHLYNYKITGGMGSATVTDSDGQQVIQQIPVTIINNPPVAAFASTKDVLDITAPDKHVTFDASYHASPADGGSYDPDGGPANIGRGPIPCTTAGSGGSCANGNYKWSIISKLTGQAMDLQTTGGQNAPTSSKVVTQLITCSRSDGKYHTYSGSGLIDDCRAGDPVVADVYDIYLTVTDNDGESSTVVKEIAVNEAPRAVASTSGHLAGGGSGGGGGGGPIGIPTYVITPANGDPDFLLNGTASYDPDDPSKTVTHYRWEIYKVGSATLVTSCDDLTNGGTPSCATFQPHLAGGFTYEARLYVTDKYGTVSPLIDNRILDGAVAQTTLRLKVNLPPTVPALPFYDVRRQLPYTFAASGVVDPDGSIQDYTWTFKELSGSLIKTETDTTGSFTYTFANPNTIRTVSMKLKVFDTDGGWTEVSYSDGSLPAGLRIRNATPQMSFGSTIPASLKAGTDGTVSDPATFSFQAVNVQDPDGSLQANGCSWKFKNPGGSYTTVGPGPCSGAFLSQSYAWTTPGFYSITFSATDTEGDPATSIGSITTGINVYWRPHVDFSTNPNPPALTADGANMSFNPGASNDPPPATGTNDTLNGGSITSYLWDFGDGSAQITTLLPAVQNHKFFRASPANTGTNGLFRVRLTATNALGITGYAEKLVRVNVLPVAVIDGSPLGDQNLWLNCARPAVVGGSAACTVQTNLASGSTLEGLQSYDPDGGPGHASSALISSLPAPASFEWHLVSAVGTLVSTQATPTFTFNSFPGQTKLYLIVKDQDGSPSIALRTFLRVNWYPTVSATGTFSFQRNVPTNVTQVSGIPNDNDPEDVPPSPAPSNLTYAWTFKDTTGLITLATSTAKNPIVTIGSVVVNGSMTFTATDTHGLSTSVTYPYNVTDAAPVAVVTTCPSPNASCASDVAPTGTSPATPTVLVPNSTLVFTVPAATVNPSFKAVFDSRKSYDPDGNLGAIKYLTAKSWTLTRAQGTGTPTGTTNFGAVPTVNPTFTGFGFWQLTLVVEETPLGRTSTLVFNIKINKAPTASFTATPTFIDNLATAVSVDGSASADLDGVGNKPSNPGTYLWDWGDGTTTSVPAPLATATHTYTGYGNFPIRLTVTDADGATANAGPTNIRVNQKPVGVVNPAAGIVLHNAGPYTATLNGTGSVDNDGSILTTRWNFVAADGTTVLSTQTPANPTVSVSYAYPSTPATYFADLVLTDNEGSTSTTRVPVRVNKLPTAVLVAPASNIIDFNRYGAARTMDATGSADADSGTVAVPSGIASYTWTFKDETGVTIKTVTTNNVTVPVQIQQLVPTANHPGQTGTVYLTITDVDGDVSLPATHTFTAYSLRPTAVITTNPSPAVVADTPAGGVTFSGASSSDDGTIVTWTWTFTNNATGVVTGASGQSVAPALAAGNYVAKLVVVDNDGLDSTVNDDLSVRPPVTVPVTIKGRPVPVITTNPVVTTFQGSSVQTVTFDALATTDPDNAANTLTYNWQFVNRLNQVMATQAGVGPFTIQFVGYGINSAILTVADPTGLQATVTRQVILNQQPQAFFTATPPVVNPGQPTTISFNSAGSGDADGSLVAYSWKFYGTDGTNVVGTGTVLGSNTGIGPVTFTYPNIAGTYWAELTVTDNSGGTGFKRIPIRFNTAPTAVAPAGVLAIQRSLPFTLDGSGSTDPDSSTGQFPSGINNYKWEFFDETGVLIQTVNSSAATTPVAVNTLVPSAAHPGQKGTLKLTVTDTDGANSTTVSTQYTVSNVAPTAAIISTPSYLIDTPPFSVTFYHVQSNDPDGTIISYHWQVFPHGAVTPTLLDITETDPNDSITYNFAAFGSFDVKLTVTDDLGATGSTFVVVKANRPPTAGIAGSGSLSAKVGVAKTFDGSSPTNSSDTDGTIASWSWIFTDPLGNTTSAVGATPSMTFNTAGPWSVVLTVTDNDGAIGSTPPINFTVTP